VLVAVYVLLNIINVIPYSEPVSYVLSFRYPVHNQGPLITSNKTIALIAQITVSASETIAENVPVTISNAIGSISSSMAENVSSIAICFQGAYLLPTHPSGGHVLLSGTPCSGTVLLETNLPVTGLGVYLNGPSLVGEDETIEWPVQGDYFATLVLYARNGTILTQDYQQNRVHVEPASIIGEEKASRNIQSLEVATFVFALTWLIFFVERRLVERHGRLAGRLKHDTNHKTDTSTQKIEGKITDYNRKKKGFQQKHYQRAGKKHR
jgi:hypothetical protein